MGDQFGCPVEATLAVIGGKWKAVLIFHMMHTGPHRFAELKRKTDDGNAEIGAKRIERAAGKIENFMHAEDELQPGRDQKEDGGVKHAAEQNVSESGHRSRLDPPQTLKFAVLIHSQKLAPAGFWS